MTILKIVKYPNKILQEVCSPVEEIDQNLKVLAYDMLETMYNCGGIGLAANQVGISKRLLVLDLQEEDKKNPMIIINPSIIWISQEQEEQEEGCLSLPKVYSLCIRSQKIKISYLDLNSQKQELEAEGLLARCLQHEIDHLNGIMFIDKLSKLKKNMLVARYKKSQKENNT